MIGLAVAVALAAVLPVAALGPWATRGAAATTGGRPAGRIDGPGRARPPRWAAVGLVAVAAVPAAAASVLGWPITVVVVGMAAVGWARCRVVAGRRAAAQRAVDRAAPDAVELLVLAAAAGHPPHRCVRLVAERAPPEVRDACAVACRRLDRGASLVDAVGALRTGLGALGDPVADALVDAFRSGAALAPALDRVAVAARDRRRRAAEVRARRLPVHLLFPLVCCVLPAFGLLAVVPLVAASVRSLG